MPVRDRVVVNHAPAVGQLESVLQDHEPIGVLLADRQRARMLVFELGELARAQRAVRASSPAGDAGHADRGDLDARARGRRPRPPAPRRRRRLAGVPGAALRATSSSARPTPSPRELESLLHPYLRERLCGRHRGGAVGALGEIREAALEVEQRIDRRREARWSIGSARRSASGRRGVAGLAATLQALNERRVERLLVSDGYAEEGWRCPSPGALAAVGPTSPVTGERMDRVDDVVEDAVERRPEPGLPGRGVRRQRRPRRPRPHRRPPALLSAARPAD